MIELRAIPGPTGRLLRQMLLERGVLAVPAVTRVQGVVNYGYGGPSNWPTLNARAGTLDKYEELRALHASDILVPRFAKDFRMFREGLVMGRDLHHTRGQDIVIYRAGEGGPRKDYYTQLISKRREFRVWAFRRKCIGVYEKVLRYPHKNGRRGRSREVWNHKNGYAFLYCRPETVDEHLKELGRQTVDALGLDFGAVDIILGTDGRYYVLECNCAPGVEGPRQALTSLVNHIERWARNRFKRRNGDEPRPNGVGTRG